MALNSPDDIITFYKNIYAQALQYNISLVPCEKSTTTCGNLYHELPDDTKHVINTILNTKFQDDSVLSKDFPEAHDLLSTKSSGSELLYYVPMMKYQKLPALFQLISSTMSEGGITDLGQLKPVYKIVFGHGYMSSIKATYLYIVQILTSVVNGTATER